jgi:hypothetical protein
MRSRLLWLLLSLAVLVILASTFRALALSVLRFDRWEEVAEPLLAQLLLPLIMLAGVLVVLCGKDCGPYALSKGELDILLRRKQQGALLQRSQRIRESAARTSSCAQDARRSFGVGLLPLADREGVLDRLVQLKRRGAWAPQRTQWEP